MSVEHTLCGKHNLQPDRFNNPTFDDVNHDGDGLMNQQQQQFATTMLIKTPAEVLHQGLALVHYDGERQARARNSSNEQQFRDIYGSTAEVVTVILMDLQTTNNPQSRINFKTDKEIEYFFQAHHFLSLYGTESERTATFGTCVRLARDRVWEIVEKIASLKTEKITWPATWVDGGNCPNFPISVDCSHFVTFEVQTDPIAPQDRRRYSHKTHGPAVSYEAALSIHECRIVSINGPFPAGVNDLTIFRNKLEALIPTGSKAIADKAYRSSRKATTASSADAPDLKRFKTRARMRQEALWRRLKQFQSLGNRFRHPIEKHQLVFEAVCVIVQYQFENGSPLFAV
jgi:hypothetical protein